MSVVVAARHLELDERVAIKVLHPNLASPHFTARFIREARNAARIKSEHAPRFIDVGWLRGGVPYLVMEYLEGQTLAGAMAAGSEMAIVDAVDHVLEACDAVAAAHINGILHRDLKPSNLFLTTRLDGSAQIKVLDFGVSRALNSSGEREDEGLTIADVTLGTHDYKAPEQILGRDVDARCDVWALGAILYTLLTRRPPFAGNSVQDVIRAILTASPVSPRLVRPEIHPELEGVVLRCLQADREKRPASIAKLALFLQQHASERARHLPMSILKAGRRARRLSGSQIGGGLDAMVARDVAAPEIEVLFDATENTASEAMPSLPRPAPAIVKITRRSAPAPQPSAPPARRSKVNWYAAVAAVAVLAIVLSVAALTYRGSRADASAQAATVAPTAAVATAADAHAAPETPAVPTPPAVSASALKSDAPVASPPVASVESTESPVAAGGVGPSRAVTPKGGGVRVPPSPPRTRSSSSSPEGTTQADPWGWER
jgi:serine/threonine-protein kinase